MELSVIFVLAEGKDIIFVLAEGPVMDVKSLMIVKNRYFLYPVTISLKPKSNFLFFFFVLAEGPIMGVKCLMTVDLRTTLQWYQIAVARVVPSSVFRSRVVVYTQTVVFNQSYS